ncbi:MULTISPECIES: hypothetical protein [Campylobacter]|uniref:hypothetical protein n=1 Tax=Campylobacter TaxID=194 RepID=UPI0008754076|nr:MULTISPECIES: hypothetical protein [Campylobacter]EAI7263297.1 hypothetical protein [Campylobacter lari]EJV5920789.1 hypothetical protein [Campylobacter lari]MCV3399062.1 hypothetical protein [Campylobacter lari]MCV3414624.1 hypothetical protein [Campylobacter lari]MCV3531305.1 hypothetical protein [Campylobacter sp. CNRCH_2007_0968H]
MKIYFKNNNYFINDVKINLNIFNEKYLDFYLVKKEEYTERLISKILILAKEANNINEIKKVINQIVKLKSINDKYIFVFSQNGNFISKSIQKARFNQIIKKILTQNRIINSTRKSI